MLDFRATWERCFVFAIGLACVIAPLGCNRGPKMYQVSGKVQYKGGVAPRAGVNIVSFLPAKDSTAEIRQPATGPIAEDGSFTMSTRVSGDGVHAGEYNVLFNVSKGPMDPTSLILPKYTSIQSPPYKVTVDQKIDDLSYEIEALPGAAAKP